MSLAQIIGTSPVAQASKPAVSRVSKPARRPARPTPCRLGSRRHSRFGNLRYRTRAARHRNINRCENLCRDRDNYQRVRLPRPVRHERGEGRGEGCFTMASGPALRSASSPQPSPPFRTEEREPEAPERLVPTFAKIDKCEIPARSSFPSTAAFFASLCAFCGPSNSPL